MQRLLASKLIIIAVLMVLLTIGLGSVRSMIYERKSNYTSVLSEIAHDHVGAQTVLGPVLVVPYHEVSTCQNDDKKNCTYYYQTVVTPEQLTWQHELKVSDHDYRIGIYQALTYQDIMAITGELHLPANLLQPSAKQVIDWNKAQLRFYVADLRGFNSLPVLSVGLKKHVFAFNHAPQMESVDWPYVSLPWLNVVDNQGVSTVKFNLDVDLAGMSSLDVIPISQDLQMTMHANWPHPRFYGSALPDKKMGQQDFSAHWQNSFVANTNNQRLSQCFDQRDDKTCTLLQGAFTDYLARAAENAYDQAHSVDVFGVSLVQPVDVYLMSDRALKYALLVLVITFGSFFLFELLKDLRIHPVQYGLVGAALVVFYLLLLSFSEHLNFAQSYMAASIACISLLVFYLSYVLQRFSRAVLFGVLLAGMYATLYVILQSEDFTLLLGSVLIFVLLAVTMFVTRHINWYGQKEVTART